MTQEEIKLLLTDLSYRSLYGVKLNIRTQKTPVTLSSVNPENLCVCYTIEGYEFISISNIANCRPYLYPISSMNNEQIDKLFDILKIDKDGNDEDWIKINDVTGIKFFLPTGKWIEDMVKVYDYLNSIHIDYRGLIDSGLAIDVTTVKFDVYGSNG